jgi:GTP-binding protein
LIDQTLKTSHIEPVWQQRNLADNETIKVYGFEEEQIDIQILNKGNGQWEVTGKSIFKIYQKFPLATSDNLLLFNEKLRSIGLYDLLRERGIKVGDIVKIFDYQLEWVD